MPRTLSTNKFRFYTFLILIIVLIFWAGTQVQAQIEKPSFDLQPLTKAKRISIPFELKGGFIMVNVRLGKLKRRLRFIVDTGAENTVLFEKSLGDRLNVPYRREFQVRGADLQTILKAYLVTSVDLQLDEVLLARGRSFLVLDENVMDLSGLIGEQVDGILGADFLMRFTVEIDYDAERIILYDPRDWEPRRRDRRLAAAFTRNRPFVFVPLAIGARAAGIRKLLVDTGADLSLLVHTVPDSLRTPSLDSVFLTDVPTQTVPTKIANGLGGGLRGSVGRSRSLLLADKELSGVITYFQPIDTAMVETMAGRQGIIGNELLRRFVLTVDYPRRQVYLRPEGRAWKKTFRYDRSGLTILAGGPSLRTYNVADVVPGSPADEAGFRVGDRLMAVNGKPVYLMTLDGILRRLRGKVGRRIRLRVARDGGIVTNGFALRELI